MTLTEVKRPKVNCDAYGRQLIKATPFVKNGDNCVTLDWWKCYLDSCASYHTFFMKQFLTNITQGGATMTGNCNAGTTTANKQGSYGDFRVWLNKQGIANLISLPMLEASGYIVSTHTHGQWVVTSPLGEENYVQA